MQRVRSPIKWFGGKGNRLSLILPLLPSCHTYVEPFGGGASVLLNREPSPVEVYNDIDGGLVNFFRVLADPNLFWPFLRRVDTLPYSRQLWSECVESWEDQTDPIEKAWRWFLAARQSFAGHFAVGWGFDRRHSTVGRSGTVSAWLSALGDLPLIHARLSRVQIEHVDWEHCIDLYDTPETLFYLDPPYLPEVRRSGEYAHELSYEDHERLIEKLKAIQGMAALSGYPNELYDQLLKAGWERRDFIVPCHAVGRTRGTGLLGEGALQKDQLRTESLWRNPACVARWQKETQAPLALFGEAFDEDPVSESSEEEIS